MSVMVHKQGFDLAVPVLTNSLYEGSRCSCWEGTGYCSSSDGDHKTSRDAGGEGGRKTAAEGTKNGGEIGCDEYRQGSERIGWSAEGCNWTDPRAGWTTGDGIWGTQGRR